MTRLRAPAVPLEVVPWLSDPERQLGHYILVSLLGTGGMAEVWKAWDRSLGRWVAVKYLKREIGHPTQGFSSGALFSGGAVERFRDFLQNAERAGLRERSVRPAGDRAAGTCGSAAGTHDRILR